MTTPNPSTASPSTASPSTANPSTASPSTASPSTASPGRAAGPPPSNAELIAMVRSAYHQRDADERADLLGSAVDGGATDRFTELAAQATGEDVLALCLLARNFYRHVPLSAVTPWFESADVHERVAVVRTTALRPVTTELMALVRRAVSDPDAAVRVAAIRSVRENRDTNLRALLSPLSADSDPAVRRWYADL